MSLETTESVFAPLRPGRINRLVSTKFAPPLYFVIAMVMNFWHLGSIKGFIFDEVYYAKDGHSLLLHAVELNGKGGAEFIVHPPVGKWLIAMGIKLFGFNEFGWRASAALIGALSVFLIFELTKKLFASFSEPGSANNLIYAHISAILMLLDGMHLVMSRTGLLDIFLMFFTLLAAYALFTRHHIFSAISLGLASATKWSGLYYIVAFFLWALYLDYLQERAIENQTPIKSALQAALPKRLAQYGLITVATYVASWSGWFFTNNGWDRNWSNKSWGIVPAVLRNFWHYHAEILGFHQNLHDRHPYMSNPWSWLIQGRPTSFFYATPKGCGGGNCSREVLALGTPLIWWSAIFAIFVLIGYAISKRDQIAQFILLLIGAGWLPWFTFQKRTMFTFYTIAFEPFIILAVVYAIARATGGPQLSISKNEIKWRWRLVLIYLIAVALCFAYFAPLYFGNTIAYHDWYAKMWFPSWI